MKYFEDLIALRAAETHVSHLSVAKIALKVDTVCSAHLLLANAVPSLLETMHYISGSFPHPSLWLFLTGYKLIKDKFTT